MSKVRLVWVEEFRRLCALHMDDYKTICKEFNIFCHEQNKLLNKRWLESDKEGKAWKQDFDDGLKNILGDMK
jgi:hypothetical protein